MSESGHQFRGCFRHFLLRACDLPTKVEGLIPFLPGFQELWQGRQCRFRLQPDYERLAVDDAGAVLGFHACERFPRAEDMIGTFQA